MIAKNINFAPGLINAIDPTSSGYPEGAAYVSTNSRIDEDGVWAKGPALTNTVINGYDSTAASGNIVRGPNNTRYILSGGSVTGGKTTAVSVPTVTVAKSASLKGARQESGIYFYMAVNYDATYNVESLPSTVKEHWVGRRYDTSDQRVADVPVLSGGGANTRWYRSTVMRVKKGDTVQLGNLADLKFYFLGEGSGWNDYAHDSEIARPENMYEGRGGFRPTSNIDAIGSFYNRMFYFVDNVAYFSCAGRPEQVPSEYTLTITHTFSNGVWSTGTFKDQLTASDATTSTLTRKPLLNTNLYASAKMSIIELIGRTVVRAEPIGGKLWVLTADSIGHIVPADNLEGFKYTHIADGFGLCSAWTLVTTPYGVFGADKDGIWLFNDGPRRVSLGKVDITTSTKDTYFNPANLSSSFGVWVEPLNEYWWSLSNKQIVYQADNDRFVGTYKLSCSTNVAYLDGLYQCHLVRKSNTPILSARSGVQTLKFWLGQESAPSVKDGLDIDVIYTGITATKTVTAAVYQNQRASETGATSSTSWSHTDSDLVGKLKPPASGRFFEVSLSIPSDCTAPIAGLAYSANVVTRRERALR